MGGLKSRLSRLKDLGFKATGHPVPRTAAPPEGWEAGEPHEYWRLTETSFALDPADFEKGFDQGLFSPTGVLSSSSGRFEDLAFFDFETTGLSGGAGTIAFLAAIGWFEGLNLIVLQVFIDDFPGEPAFLARVLDRLAERGTVVTYNGASFDMPLLRTRCVLNRIPGREFRHIDALKTARRFWSGSLSSCALQALEAELLGYQRTDDIPGFLIPRIWLEYSGGRRNSSLEDPRALMEKVFAHNVRDIVSLARVFCLMNKIAENPIRRAGQERVRLRSLAAILINLGRRPEGVALLEEALAAGDSMAGLALARLLRGEGDWRGYEEILLSLEENDPRVCVEKAKFWEHRRRDYPAALACVQRAADLLTAESGRTDGSIRFLEDIAKRKRRLEFKSKGFRA
jgi:hypothetical protein